MQVNKLTIIIVNWNTCGLLRQCLESIAVDHIIDCEILVVDNGSIDSSINMVEKYFPHVNIVNNMQNLGFARANNIAIKKTNSEYVCLLNSDTVVTPDCMENMLKFMASRKDVVACGPALRLPDGKLQTGGAGFELTLSSAFNYYLFLSKLFPFTFNGFYVDQEAYVRSNKPTKVGWLAGACLMVRRSAIDKVGGLDESYFMYAEDAEWCDRLRQVGDIYYLPNLEIIHYHGASSSAQKMITTKWLEATFQYYQSKYGRYKTELFRLVLISGFFIRMLMYSILTLRRKSYWNNCAAMAKYLQYSLIWKNNT